MSRTFAYCRVSTREQHTENQVVAIHNAGYTVEANRIVSEQVSGGIPAMQREMFKQLVDVQMEAGDTLVVLKLDRLGRDNIDIQQTAKLLDDKQINIICLDLPEPDLSSAGGRMMFQMFAVFAEFEKGRIAERTKEGLDRAKAQGKKLGRPVAVKQTEEVQRLKATGLSQSKVAKELQISISTVKRHWNK